MNIAEAREMVTYKVEETLNDAGTVFVDQDGQFAVRYQGTVRHPEDVRGSKCPICGLGWEMTPERVLDQWRNDVGLVHKTCYERWLQFHERRELVLALRDVARSELIGRIQPIPNECGGVFNTCWYVVETDEIFIRVGFRKRVWHVELRAKTGVSLDFENIERKFEDIKQPKLFEPGRCYVHAASDEKMRLYLAMLLESVPKEK